MEESGVKEGEAKGRKFLQSYRNAFESLDVARIADHFAYPLHLISDANQISLIVLGMREDWVPQLERLVAGYRRIGVRAARAREIRIVSLSSRLLQAIVRWELLDSAGAVLYAFEASYTLVEIDGKFQIGALAHNEVPRLREQLARHSSGRPSLEVG